MWLKCPACGAVFNVTDPCRPFRCPKCGSLLDVYNGKARLLIPVEDMLGERR